MTLDQYLKQNGITERQAARELEVIQATIWRWRNKRRMPGPDQVAAIYRWSNGQVAPGDWYDLPSLEGKQCVA